MKQLLILTAALGALSFLARPADAAHVQTESPALASLMDVATTLSGDCSPDIQLAGHCGYGYRRSYYRPRYYPRSSFHYGGGYGYPSHHYHGGPYYRSYHGGHHYHRGSGFGLYIGF